MSLGGNAAVDVDLRKVRYFVAVAEELHFGRAAERLNVAQPVISRQIWALEEELNSQLFVRDRRHTELTAAGRQPLEEARPLLLDADAPRRRVGRAGRGSSTFAVGFMPGLIVTPVIRALSVAHPDLVVDVLRTSWTDQVEVLHDGPMSTCSKILPRSSRQPVPTIRTAEEKLERVATGQGIVILPLSTTTFYRRSDVVSIPVDDISPNQVSLAWEATRRSRLIYEFADLAGRHEQHAT